VIIIILLILLLLILLLLLLLLLFHGRRVSHGRLQEGLLVKPLVLLLLQLPRSSAYTGVAGWSGR
jgi:hypothetical protein